MNYRSEIDGLRALAIIPVILFHIGVNAFCGGFVGVDIFFVISGYLITTILINDLEADRFSIFQFYERRARRILPALFFVILTSIPFAWILLSPNELISFSKSISATSLFISNFFFWKDGGYFESAAELKPLLHTWSLAVEEQYYIFFPIGLLWAWRVGKKFSIKAVVFVAIISLVLAQIGSILKPVPNFFLLPSRVWELGMGAIAAFLLIDQRFSKIGLKGKQTLSLCGLLFILLALFLFDSETPFPSIYSLLPTVGAVLIILFAENTTFVGWILSTNIFVGIGLVSYSAYLWHQPIIAFSKAGSLLFGEISKITIVTYIFLISILSWKFIEVPFRNKAYKSNYIFAGLVAVSFMLLFFGNWSYRSLAKLNHESAMAKELSTNVAIFASNMDERKFIKSRIEVEEMSPQIIVLGSSRIMQISSRHFGKELLNLGVSGSSIEDDVAIWKLASVKFEPSLVLIGVDPWLLNDKSGQYRWKSLEVDYYLGLIDLGVGVEETKTLISKKNGVSDNFLIGLYKTINVFKIASDNDSPELIDKIRRDGSRVYNISYSNHTQNQIELEAISFASYGMLPYQKSIDIENIFEKLLLRIKEKHKVVLVLSPYHPKLYEFMKTEDKKFIDIEEQFRSLAAKLNVKIIGSYNPAEVGCISSEFYDGMHPKESCMNKVISYIR